jgi:hypothetical protein
MVAWQFAFSEPDVEPRTEQKIARDAEHLGFTPKAIKSHPFGVQRQKTKGKRQKDRRSCFRL